MLMLRALASGVPNVKFLTYGTPNTKIFASSGDPNHKFFPTCYDVVLLIERHCRMWKIFFYFYSAMCALSLFHLLIYLHSLFLSSFSYVCYVSLVSLPSPLSAHLSLPPTPTKPRPESIMVVKQCQPWFEAVSSFIARR